MDEIDELVSDKLLETGEPKTPSVRVSEMDLSNVQPLNPLGMITEISMSRLLHHSKETPFAILSGFRGEHDKEAHPVAAYDKVLTTNRRRNKILLNRLTAQGYHPIHVQGHTNEAPQDMDFGTAKLLGKVTPVDEESFLVLKPQGHSFSSFHKNITAAGKDFSQDSVLFHHPKAGAWLHFSKDDTHMKLGPLHTKEHLGQYYTHLRKSNRWSVRKFNLQTNRAGVKGEEPPKHPGGQGFEFGEATVYPGAISPGGMLGAMGFSKLGLSWFSMKGD